MKPPAISVLITTYNMQGYIARAMDSVLRQQVTMPYEIVIADDCSTDDTLKIVANYQEKFPDVFIVLQAQQNCGLITNFVNGIKNCTAAYIATLDADDYWIDEYKLQKQYDLLNKHATVGYVYTNFFYEDEISKKRRVALLANHQPDNNNLYAETLTTQPPQISNTFIRKAFIDFSELETFVRLQFHCQDLPLFTMLSLTSKALYIDDVTTVYTVRQGSMSRDKNVKKRIEVFEQTFFIENYFIAKQPLSLAANQKRIFNFHRKCFLASWFANDFLYTKTFRQKLTLKDFLQYDPKTAYVFIAAQNSLFYNILKPWILRKRRPGK